MGSPSLFSVAHMRAVFGCMSNRTQNLSMSRLFNLKAAGRIKASALAYLDQNEGRLAHSPADLVTRSSVADYSTDFSAMSPDWVDRPSKRCEQMTYAVLLEHPPGLL